MRKLGKIDNEGRVVVRPNVSISGQPLPASIYTTVAVPPGYFYVPDMFPAYDADQLQVWIEDAKAAEKPALRRTRGTVKHEEHEV